MRHVWQLLLLLWRNWIYAAVNIYVIMNIHYRIIISNKTLYLRCNTCPLFEGVQLTRWKLPGHILKSPENRLAQIACSMAHVPSENFAATVTCLKWSLWTVCEWHQFSSYWWLNYDTYYLYLHVTAYPYITLLTLHENWKLKTKLHFRFLSSESFAAIWRPEVTV